MNIHQKIGTLIRDVYQVNQERSRIIQEIELLLRRPDMNDDEIGMLDQLVEDLGGYITRPWGCDDLVVKLPTGE